MQFFKIIRNRNVVMNVAVLICNIL